MAEYSSVIVKLRNGKEITIGNVKDTCVEGVFYCIKFGENMEMKFPYDVIKEITEIFRNNGGKQ